MVFCSQCGIAAEGRFCFSCGARLAESASNSTSGLEDEPPVYAITSPPAEETTTRQTSLAYRYHNHSTAVPHPSHLTYNPNPPRRPPPARPPITSRLLDAYGQRTAAFDRLVSTLFLALDQSFEPRDTHGIELEKMIEFRRMTAYSQKNVPRDYKLLVLPLYYDMINAECVPSMPGDHILTWEGFCTFLQQKIAALPDETFEELAWAVDVLDIELPQKLVRTDLPRHPHPEARAREDAFGPRLRQLRGQG